MSSQETNHHNKNHDADDDHMMMMEEVVDPASAVAIDDDDDDIDSAPVFVQADEAVEVPVDDDAPMDDDDDDAATDALLEDGANDDDPPPPPDMSRWKVESHTGPVYGVACHLTNTTTTTTSPPRLTLVTGGGDDRAFLHHHPLVPEQQPPQATLLSSQLLEHVHTDSVSAVALNLDYVSDDLTKTPRLAVVGAYDGAILLYDPDTGTKVHSFEGPTDVEWAAFHPKGGSVLLVGSAADNTVWMFHIPLQKCLQVFVGHEAAVTAGNFSPDGRWALSASSDGTVRVWAPRTGVCKHVFRFHNIVGGGGDEEEPAGLTCMAVNGGSDNQLLVVGAEDGQAHVCHIGTKKVVASVRHTEVHNAPLAQGNPMEDDDEDGEQGVVMSVEAVGFAPCNTNWLATAGVDGVLKIWDLANAAQCRQTCRPPSSAAGEGITRLQWHPRLPLCFTASTSGVVRLWDARNGSLLTSLTGHTDVINDLSVCYADSDGKKAFVATASDDKTVRLFELDIPALLQAAHV